MKRHSKRTIRRISADALEKPSQARLARLAARLHGEPDADNPEWTASQIKRAAHARDKAIRKANGRLRKERITIHLDSDLIVFFRAPSARGYQSRINDALRRYVTTRTAESGHPSPLLSIEAALSALADAKDQLTKVGK